MDGILAVVATALTVSLPIAVPLWFTARHGQKKIGRKVGEISDSVGEMKDQVVNGHGDDPDKNLRVQLDRIENVVAELRGEMRGEIRQLTHRVDRLER